MKKFALFSAMLLCIYTALAQNNIKGKITDNTNHTALNGASVYIPDLKLGSITDANGKYSIKNVPHGTYLVVASFLGYASQAKEITIKETATADFMLTQSAEELKNVIETGVSTATEQQTNPVPVNIVTNKEMLQNSSTNI